MKKCVRCKTTRRNIEYRKDKQNRDGMASYCKPCYATYNRHRLYGLSEEEFRAFYVAQDGKCNICREEMKTPHVEHDHDTGKVRGLTCGPCNLGLGKLGDDIETVLMAALHLIRGAKL